MSHENEGLNEREATENLAMVQNPMEKHILEVEILNDIRCLKRDLVLRTILHLPDEIFPVIYGTETHIGLIESQANLFRLLGIIYLL